MILDCLFVLLLVYAAFWDIKTRTVQNGIWIAVAVLGLLKFEAGAVTGMLVMFIPMLILGLCSHLGGGDIKLAGACGLYLGYAAVPGLLIACLSTCIAVPIYCAATKKQIRQTAFPFVPFLALGFGLMAISNIF